MHGTGQGPWSRRPGPGHALPRDRSGPALVTPGPALAASGPSVIAPGPSRLRYLNAPVGGTGC